MAKEEQDIIERLSELHDWIVSQVPDIQAAKTTLDAMGEIQNLRGKIAVIRHHTEPQ